MSKFLETYGVAIFTLVLVAILIAFAGPLGIKIKEYTLEKAEYTEQIGKDEITVATGGTVRPAEPAEAVDSAYYIYYSDKELVIAQKKIEPETGRTVLKKGFYDKPSSCTKDMLTVRFVGAVKPKSCNCWFQGCTYLKEIKNIENLYTNECTDMGDMFGSCKFLGNLDVSHFDTSKVKNMSYVFNYCYSLKNIDLTKWDTNQATSMLYIFDHCTNLTSIKVSKQTSEKMNNFVTKFKKSYIDYIGTTSDKFIVSDK